MNCSEALRRQSLRVLAAVVFSALALTATAQSTLNSGPAQVAAESNAPSAPLRLRQIAPTQQSGNERAPSTNPNGIGQPRQPGQQQIMPGGLYVPGEFEKFVQRQAGSDIDIRRLGAELVTLGADQQDADQQGAELSPLVPADYLVSAGDEILVTLWGSVDADLRLTVDRSGRISIPRVGTVQVAGIRNDDLAGVVNRRIAQVFRNFESSVSIGQLRGIRVFVTGFVVRPGAYTVTSLSTVVAALMRAGGPSAAGSFRNIELRRGSALVSRFDLYDLLLKGDRSGDRTIQAGDVVHVGPVGTQVGFIGSVNSPAILEMKPGEGVSEALGMVGGFSAVADRSRLAVERLQDRNAGRVAQLELPADERSTLASGDVLRAFSAVSAALPTERQNKRVKIEGEVMRPAEYVLPEGSSVSDAIRAAGGFSKDAFVFATVFTRQSVQQTQQENYERALRDLETDLARAAGSQRVAGAEDAASLAASNTSSQRLVERLRNLRPTGRIVLQMAPGATELPDLALEDGDRILIPARPTTVGVFGSVFNAASYLYLPGRSVDDYLKLAGGPTKGADEGSIFIVRANGNVVSNRQKAGWFNNAGDLVRLPAEAGDTLFVPEEMNKTTFLQSAKDWTQILSQFGLGLAAIKVLGN